MINILLTELSRSVCENLDLGISQSDQARVILAGNESHIRIRDNKNNISLFKSDSPKISPGGVQNEKIENPQTLPEYRSR